MSSQLFRLGYCLVWQGGGGILLLCVDQPLDPGMSGVVNSCASSAVLFATAKGANDLSLRSFSL